MNCKTSRKSTGAYVIAGTEAARELAWIVGFLQSIGFGSLLPVPVLYGDNKGALALAKHNVYRPRTRAHNLIEL